MKQWRDAHRLRGAWPRLTFSSLLTATILLVAVAIFVGAVTPEYCLAQTRAECNKCCQEMFSDDYYVEQCKLKCFRDANYCNSLRASKPAGGRSEQHTQQAPVERQIARPEPPTTTRPQAVPSQETQQRRVERTPPRQAPFVWPETLVLNPGREWEAAGQILAANGIPPQHPNYTPALKAIEQVLVDFARTNPGGGELPTDQLERIIGQARR